MCPYKGPLAVFNDRPLGIFLNSKAGYSERFCRAVSKGLARRRIVHVLFFLQYWLSVGVLAGAIDYYILDKYQRIANTKPYDEVSHTLAVRPGLETLEVFFH